MSSAKPPSRTPPRPVTIFLPSFSFIFPSLTSRRTPAPRRASLLCILLLLAISLSWPFSHLSPKVVRVHPAGKNIEGAETKSKVRSDHGSQAQCTEKIRMQYEKRERGAGDLGREGGKNCGRLRRKLKSRLRPSCLSVHLPTFPPHVLQLDTPLGVGAPGRRVPPRRRHGRVFLAPE